MKKVDDLAKASRCFFGPMSAGDPLLIGRPFPLNDNQLTHSKIIHFQRTDARASDRKPPDSDAADSDCTHRNSTKSRGTQGQPQETCERDRRNALRHFLCHDDHRANWRKLAPQTQEDTPARLGYAARG
jgi:hypothetical protein